MKLFKRMVFVVCLLTMLGVVAVPPIMAKAEDGSTKDLGKGYIIVTVIIWSWWMRMTSMYHR